MGDLSSFPNEDIARANNALPHDITGDSHADQPAEAADAPIGTRTAHKSGQSSDRRKRRRALISAPVRVRGLDVTDGGPDEVLTTTNVSRVGLMFHTLNRSYKRGMEVAVTFPYSSSSMVAQAERGGHVARITELSSGGVAIAIAFEEADQAGLVDTGGNNMVEAPAQADQQADQLPDRLPDVNSKKPLVLAVDTDNAVRHMVKTYLSEQGYDVIAVGTSEEAKEVLKIFKPALIIAEIEGENLPGYDLCVHVKSNDSLARIPVMLMTSSAYPSDYSSAHSLGAVVCIAKPFRQERFGHVVRMLVPPVCEQQQAGPVRPADPTRRHVSPSASKYARVKSVLGNRFQLRREK